MKGRIYLVSTPIGNYDDISLRALQVLREADFIICEELKVARRMLAHYKITNELIDLNEHNENEIANEILFKILEGKTAALISDCGTPLFSDPGHLLIDLCISQKIEVIPVPGASSLMPALVGSGLDIEKFYYYGWLSPAKDQRRKELLDLRKIKELIILLDTPYRLIRLLNAINKMFGPATPVVLAFELTMSREKYYRGSVEKILSQAEKEKLKGEFVLLVDNRRYSHG